MRKLIKILAVILVIFIVIAAVLHYIKPEEKLNMDYTPVSLEEKIVEMAKEFKPEIRLSRSDINAIIKQNIERELHEQVYIDGADFYMQNSLLHGKLNITVANNIKAELTVVYSMSWAQPNLILKPYSLHIKAIPLPLKWLQKFDIPLTESEQRFVKINDVYNDGEDIVIALKVQLF